MPIAQHICREYKKMVADIRPLARLLRQASDPEARKKLHAEIEDMRQMLRKIARIESIKQAIDNKFDSPAWRSKTKGVIDNPIELRPTSAAYATYCGSQTSTKMPGAFTVNPDTFMLDTEAILSSDRIAFEKVPAHLIGQSFENTLPMIIAVYSKEYYFPGIELWQYFYDGSAEYIEQYFERGTASFFIGSYVMDMDSKPRIPSVVRGGSGGNLSLTQRGGTTWTERMRIVLIKK